MKVSGLPSLRTILGLLVCAAFAAAQPAGIEGVVLNHVTGLPLAGVHLRLVTVDFGGGGLEQAYGAISDRAGHFSITNLKPGIYLVVPERTGFVQFLSASPNMPVGLVPLKPGQQLADYKVEMTPRAVMTGRVVDEYGDPVQNVSVQLEPVSPDTQMGPSFGLQSNVATDDLGEFHLVTAPGRYRLHATRFPFQRESGPEIRTDGTSAAPYADTYYPNAASSGAASIVAVGPGQDVAGLEIRLVRGAAAEAHTLTIAGVVTGATDGAVSTIVLHYGESPEQVHNSSQTMAAFDGKFAFRGLKPGYYRVFAQYSAGKTFLLSQTINLTLGTADETALQLALAPAEGVTGTLEFTGDAPPSGPVGKQSVRLDPIDGMFIRDDSEAPQGDVGRDGAFRVDKVFPALFRPVVEPLPENAYIQSVTLNDAPAVDNILDLSRGFKGAHLKIIVARNGAQVSGAVLDSDGKPVVSPLVIIFLVDDPKQLKQPDGDDLNRVIDGKYTLKAIRPGKYRLFAVDTLALFSSAGDTDHDDDEALKTLFNSAEEIEIKPGDRIVKDLKAIDKIPAKEPTHGAPKQ